MIDVQHYLQARDRGAAYLASLQRDDGLIGEPDWGLASYYKAPWALTAAGRTAEAARLLAWVREHNFDARSGDFRGEYPRDEGLASVYPYPNGWLALAAQKLGAFDIARKAADFLVTLQYPETGGFRARPDVPPEDSPFDVMSTSMAGLACLYAGRLGNARQAAGFLRTVLDEQPEPGRALYFVWQRGQLRTQFKEENARHFVVRPEQPLQRYYQMGIAAAFLCRMSMTSGETTHVETARGYLGLAFNATEEMYRTAQAGKVGWGAALLYHLTGEDAYRELAIRVADALLEQQQPDGCWHDTGGFAEQTVTNGVTAEFVALLDEIVGALSPR